LFERLAQWFEIEPGKRVNNDDSHSSFSAEGDLNNGNTFAVAILPVGCFNVEGEGGKRNQVVRKPEQRLSIFNKFECEVRFRNSAKGLLWNCFLLSFYR
jgi:hypothetical protein